MDKEQNVWKTEKKLVSRKEAAEILGVTAQTVSNYLRDGLLRGIKSNRGTVFVCYSSIEALLPEVCYMEKIRSKARGYRLAAEQELEQSRRLFASARQGSSVLHYLKRIEGRKLLSMLVKQMGSRHLSEDNAKWIASFLDDWSADKVAASYGVTIDGFRFRVVGAIKELGKLPSYSVLEDEVEAQRDKISALLLCKKDLEQENQELRARLRIKEGSVNADTSAEDASMWELLQTDVVDVGFGIRELNAFRWADIKTLNDVVQYKETDLLKFRNMGLKSVRRVKARLEALNLELGMDTRCYREAYVRAMAEEKGFAAAMQRPTQPMDVDGGR